MPLSPPRLSSNSDLARAHNDLGCALLELGRPHEAAAAFRQSLALLPGDARVHSNLLLSLNYCSGIGRAELFAAHLHWDEIHGCRDVARSGFEQISRDPDRRLRVGYVSADFREHSVAFSIEPLLAAHDRDQVEVFCYSDVKKADAFTRRFQQHADKWIPIHKFGVDEVASRIRDDRIDLLVDLSGHTRRNWLELFTRKPAPVQLSYSGYPNTTGMKAIGYRIVDAVTDPEGADAFYSEKLIRLPRCFLAFRPHPDAGAVMPPPALERSGVTFGSFNNLAKMTPEVAALWARILHAVPGSRLLLKTRALADPASCRRVLAAFAAQQIDPGRLELARPTGTRAEHFARYGDVDIALESFPYNGTATTLEALWMGVPVIGLRGDRHSARVGASLLTEIGVPELIAESPDEYVSLAASLAADIDRLTALRRGLRERMGRSGVCDGESLAREMEKAYRTAWRAFCRGGDTGGTG